MDQLEVRLNSVGVIFVYFLKNVLKTDFELNPVSYRISKIVFFLSFFNNTMLSLIL